MLGTVVMLLQAQTGSRLHQDAFDLIARAVGKAFVAAPGAMDDVPEFGFGPGAALQLVDQRLDLLRARLVGDQHRIRRGNDNQIPNAERGEQSAFGDQDGIAAVDAQHVAPLRIAVPVGLTEGGQGIPGADVVPAGSEGNHHPAIRFFHHRIVDRVCRAGGKGDGIETQKVQITLRGGHCPGHALANSGRKTLQGLEVGVGAEEEHAAVPEVLARREVGLRGCAIGLFDEAIENVAARQRSTPTNVTVAGFCAIRQHAKGDQRSCLSVRNGRRDRLLEAGDSGDDMIRGKHQQQRRRFRAGVAEGVQRCRSNRRCRVAGGRFEQDIGLQADFEQLFGDQETMVLVADDNRLADSRKPIESAQSVLQQRELIDQAKKLLRVMGAREGPKPGPRPSTEDHRTNHGGVHVQRLQAGPTRREGIAGAGIIALRWCSGRVWAGPIMRTSGDHPSSSPLAQRCASYW